MGKFPKRERNIMILEELPKKEEIQAKFLIKQREKVIDDLTIAQINEKMAKRNIIQSVKPEENEQTAVAWKNKKKAQEKLLELIEKKLEELTEDNE